MICCVSTAEWRITGICCLLGGTQAIRSHELTHRGAATWCVNSNYPRRTEGLLTAQMYLFSVPRFAVFQMTHAVTPQSHFVHWGNSVIRLLLFAGVNSKSSQTRKFQNRTDSGFKIMCKLSPEHHITKLKQLRSTVRGFLWLNPLASKQQIIDLLVDSRPATLRSCFSSIFSEFSYVFVTS